MIVLLFFLSSGRSRKYLAMYTAYLTGWENALLKRWPRPVSGRGRVSWSSAFRFALVSIFFSIDLQEHWKAVLVKFVTTVMIEMVGIESWISGDCLEKWFESDKLETHSNVKDCMWASDNWLRKYRIGDPRASCSSHEDLDVHTHFGGICFLYGC